MCGQLKIPGGLLLVHLDQVENHWSRSNANFLRSHPIQAIATPLRLS